MYIFSFMKNLQFFGALTIPFYLYRLNMNYTQMFLVETVFSVLLFLLEVPTGVVADKWGRKISLMSGTALLGLCFAAYGLTTSFPILLLLQLPMATGLSLLSGADRALLYECASDAGCSTEKTAQITARYDAAGTGAMLAAFPLGSVFADSGILPLNTALAALFVVSGASFVLAALPLIPMHEIKRDMPQAESALQHGIDGFKFIFRSPTLKRIALNYAVISGLLFLMFWYYQALLLRFNVANTWFGFVSAGFNALGMLALLCTGTIQKKLGTSKTIMITALLPGLLYTFLGLFPSLGAAFAAIFGITVLKSFRAPVMITQMNTYISNENRATVLSGVSMIERIVISVMYVPAGALYDFSPDITFLLLGLVTVVCCFILRPTSKKSESTGANT